MTLLSSSFTNFWLPVLLSLLKKNSHFYANSGGEVVDMEKATMPKGSEGLRELKYDRHHMAKTQKLTSLKRT